MQAEQQMSEVLGEPKRRRHSQFALNEQDVKSWLHKLPRANLGHSTRNLLNALTELNDTHCPPRARLACLEVLRPEVQMALQAMSKHYSNGSMVLVKRAHQVAGLCNLLNRLLAEGYARVLCDLGGGLGLRSRKRERALACHRALVEHGQILVRTYVLHQEEPEGYWHFLHSLYGVALARHLTGLSIGDAALTGSVKTAYLHPIMLAAASPYQLSRRELLYVSRVLPQWSEFLTLRSDEKDKWAGRANGEPPESCALVFDPRADAPPHYRTLESGLEGRVGIDTERLVRLIGELSDKELNPGLRDHLVRVWSSAATRRQPRWDRGGKLEVAVGIGAAHFFVSGGDEGEFDGLQDVTDGDARYLVRMVDADGLDYATSESGEVPESVDFNAKYHIHIAGVVDRSERGFSVRLEGRHYRSLAASDLLAVREPYHRQWHLAVTRWVREPDERMCTAGLEILGMTVVPCLAEPAASGGAERVRSSRGFILLRERIPDLPQRIILPSKLFSPGRQVSIHSGDDFFDTTLGPTLATVGNYDIYSLEEEVADVGAQESPSVKSEAEVLTEAPGLVTEFDSVWSQL